MITRTVRISQMINLELRAKAPLARQLHRERENDPAFQGAIAELVSGRWKFDEGHNAQRGGAAVVAPEVDLRAQSQVAESGQARAHLRDAVLYSQNVIRLHNDLEINIVQDADL